ncbi:MAG: hypothetical protein KIG51_05940 [Fibrobacter sp.]|nr:hypothetical protein [Fibrobacter sp.]
MADVGYAQLYKLQLLFAEMDSTADAKSVAEREFSDQPSIDAVMWLYEHRRRGEHTESDAQQIDLDSLDLQAETANLYADTKALKMDGAVLDPREALAVNKLQMDLLGKILDLHERSKRVKQIGQFVEYVFNLLTDEQKGKVLTDFGNTYSD